MRFPLKFVLTWDRTSLELILYIQAANTKSKPGMDFGVPLTKSLPNLDGFLQPDVLSTKPDVLSTKDFSCFGQVRRKSGQITKIKTYLESRDLLVSKNGTVYHI